MLRREEIAKAAESASAGEVAQRFGISKGTVYHSTYRVRNLEKFLQRDREYKRKRYATDPDFRAAVAAHAKAWARANAEKVNAKARRRYHRTKKLGGVNGFWSEDQTNTLIAMYPHHTYKEIADKIGVSRSCVAGKSRRLKLEGRL